VVGQKRGPPSLMSTTEELLEGKSSGSSLENWHDGHRGTAAMITRQPSICKSWHYLRRHAAVALFTRGLRPRRRRLSRKDVLCESFRVDSSYQQQLCLLTGSSGVLTWSTSVNVNCKRLHKPEGT
jgi:hypothetical protein